MPLTLLGATPAGDASVKYARPYRKVGLCYLVRQYLTNLGLGLGCLAFQCRKRSALSLNVFAVRPSIGQALANDALCKLISALAICYAKRGAVVMAEIKLR